MLYAEFYFFAIALWFAHAAGLSKPLVAGVLAVAFVYATIRAWRGRRTETPTVQ